MWTLPNENSYFTNLRIGIPVAGWTNGNTRYQNIAKSGTAGIAGSVAGTNNTNTNQRGYWRYK